MSVMSDILEHLMCECADDMAGVTYCGRPFTLVCLGDFGDDQVNRIALGQPTGTSTSNPLRRYIHSIKRSLPRTILRRPNSWCLNSSKFTSRQDSAVGGFVLEMNTKGLVKPL